MPVERPGLCDLTKASPELIALLSLNGYEMVKKDKWSL